MRKLVLVLGLTCACTPALAAQENPQEPAWAFPATQQGVAAEIANPARDGDTAARAVAYPRVPQTAPQIVREGKNGNGVCQGCHLPYGLGQPQSAPLTGLPVAYFVRQMNDFTSGARGAYRPQMATFAQNMSAEEIRETAEYYAAQRVVPWIEVRETDTVPRTFVTARDIVSRYPDGSAEPINGRIVEVSNTFTSPYELERPAYVAYVPPGSLARGAELVNNGGGKTAACGTCHGPALKGMNDVPGIAGRSAVHGARQLLEFRNGTRGGPSAESMAGVVANLSDADIVAISAYLASLPPV